MAVSLNRIRVVSYNCRGYNVCKQPYLQSLLSQCEFLFVQEHWLADSQMHSLQDVSKLHLVHGTSGFGNTDVITGRPYGGCAIFWLASLNADVHFVSTSNRRVCSVRVCTSVHKLLLINVYMPCENDDIAYDEYNGVLADVAAIADQFADHCLILGGDFNVDFNKHKLHSSLLSNFCDGNNLSVAANHRSCDIDYTYNFCMSRFSFIDHFILPRVVFETSIVSCVVTHDGDNLSDHDPITITLDIDLNCVASSSRCYLKRHAWYKAKACDIEL